MESQQDNIINTACRMFEQFGIRSVSIDNVCNELRISKKTFYNYFSQKEELVEAVLLTQRKASNEKFARMLRNKNAVDSLILIVRELRKTAEHESQIMCFDLLKYYPKIYDKFETEKRNIIRSGFEANLRRGIAEGYYRDDLDVEMISLFHSVQIKNTFEQMSLDGKKYSKKRLIDFFTDLIIHLIANEKGLKYIEQNYNKAE